MLTTWQNLWHANNLAGNIYGMLITWQADETAQFSFPFQVDFIHSYMEGERD